MFKKIVTAAIAGLLLATAADTAAAQNKYRGKRKAKTEKSVRKGKNFYKNVSRHGKQMKIRGKRYWYYNGNYYRKYRSGYRLVAVPVGAYVKILPHGFVKIRHRGHIYYRHHSHWYRYDRVRRAYVVISPPLVFVHAGIHLHW